MIEQILALRDELLLVEEPSQEIVNAIQRLTQAALWLQQAEAV